MWEWFELLDSRVGTTTLVYKLYHLIRWTVNTYYMPRLCVFALYKKWIWNHFTLDTLVATTHTQVYHASVTSQSLKLPNHLTTTHCLGIAWILGASSLTKVLQRVDVDSIHWHIHDINLPHFRCLTSSMFLIFSFHKFSNSSGGPSPLHVSISFRPGIRTDLQRLLPLSSSLLPHPPENAKGTVWELQN